MEMKQYRVSEINMVRGWGVGGGGVVWGRLKNEKTWKGKQRNELFLALIDSSLRNINVQFILWSPLSFIIFING